MFTVFLVLIIIIAFLLILVIMVQNPKGGGLSSSFGGGGNQVVGGVKKTGDFLDKSTWTLATILIVLILLSNTALPGRQGATDAQLIDGRETQTETPVQDNTPPPANENSSSGDSNQGE